MFIVTKKGTKYSNLHLQVVPLVMMGDSQVGASLVLSLPSSLSYSLSFHWVTILLLTTGKRDISTAGTTL